MAIDTADKRRTAGNMGLPGFGYYRVPNNLIDTKNDRRAAADHYSGIISAEPTVSNDNSQLATGLYIGF